MTVAFVFECSSDNRGWVRILQDRWGGTALSDALRVKSAVGAHLLHTYGAKLGMVIPPGANLSKKKGLGV